MTHVVVASGNRHKVAELAQWLVTALPDLRVSAMTDLGDPPAIAEDADTFAGNAALKATGIAQWLAQQNKGIEAPEWVLADDSGLCVDALAGAPGVYSARFAGPSASDDDNNLKLVEELQRRGLAWSNGGYVCVLALSRVDGQPWSNAQWASVGACEGVKTTADRRCLLVEGQCRGEVGIEARGNGGFGYDPHFWIDQRTRTFAEISRETKALCSHRGQALRYLVAVIRALASSPSQRQH